MTNTNLPPQPMDPEVLREVERHLAEINASRSTTDQLYYHNTRTLQRFHDSLTRFASPLVRIEESLRRVDETNRKITQMGTTYTKLQRSLEKNSTALNSSLISQRSLIIEISKNYEQGVRVNTGALMDLSREMIATGQDMQGLRKMNSDLLFQTGNNEASVQALSKINKEVSDEYLVSNQALTRSINSLTSVMDDASFFGAETSVNFREIAKKLTARAGGRDITRNLDVLFKLMTPGIEGQAAAQLLGATGVRQKVAAQQKVGMDDLDPILQRVKAISEGVKGEQFGRTIATGLAGLGDKKEFILLQQLTRINEDRFRIEDQSRATQEERFANLATIEEKAKGFYDSVGTTVIPLLTTINTAVIGLALAGGAGGSLFGFTQRGAGGVGRGGWGTAAAGAAGAVPYGPQISRARRLGQWASRPNVKLGLGLGAGVGAGMAVGSMTGFGMEGTGAGAAMGSMAGPWGAAIGATVGLMIDIAKHTSESAEANKERVRQEKEKADRERAEEHSKDIQRINFMTGYLRSRAGAALMEDDEMKLFAQRTAEAVEKMQRERTSLSAAQKPGIR